MSKPERTFYAIVRVTVARTEDVEADRRVAVGVCDELGIGAEGASRVVLELPEVPDWAESAALADRAVDVQAKLRDRFGRRRNAIEAMGEAGLSRLASMIGPKPQTLEELGQRTIEGLAGLGMICVASELAAQGVLREDEEPTPPARARAKRKRAR